MRLVTFQTEDAFNELQSKGYLIGKKEYVSPYFLKAYQWLRQQMNDKVGPAPFLDQYPIWAWYQGGDVDDLDFHCQDIEVGQRGVRLEVEIDDKLVVLSDHDSWHAVLNNVYFSISERDSDEFDKVQLNRQARIEKSWELIFILDHGDNPWLTTGEEPPIQATFWKLELNQVTSVTWLNGTNKSSK